jgi:hypothetical protein
MNTTKRIFCAMSKIFIEIQKKFPPVPLSRNETHILQQYEKSVEDSMQRNDIKGVLQRPPYPYYKKQCWRRLQWMQVDVETKIQSLQKHANRFLKRYQKNANPEDFDRYTQLTVIVHAYKEYGMSQELITTLLCAKNPIPKKLFPYETGKIWIMDVVKYGFVDPFLEMEKKLTNIQTQMHNKIIQQKLNQYTEE